MFSNMKIPFRIALSALLPLITLCLFSIYEVNLKWETRAAMSRLQPVAEGAGKISLLVHELQRERGMSSAFLNSKGLQMRAELQQQRERTDSQRKVLSAVLREFAQTREEDLSRAAQQSDERLDKLNQLRGEIDGLTISPEQAVRNITATVGSLMSAISGLAKLSDQDDVSKVISAYANLGEGKELAGLERATVAGGIAAGRFELPGLLRSAGLVAAQESFFKAFRSTATPQARALYESTLKGAPIEAFDAMRKTVEAGGLAGTFNGLTSKSWFDAATARIDLLKSVEDGIAAELSALAARKISEATVSLLIMLSLLLAVLVASCIAVLVMARSITTPLGVLCNVMSVLAKGDITQKIEGTRRGDEIGAMARAVAFFKESLMENRELAAREAGAIERRSARTAKVTDLTERFDLDAAAVLKAVADAGLQLQTTASSMDATAEETSRQATVVTAASSETSANVQAVASAAEELSGSVAEISRQVAHSTEVARQAVDQASHTNITVQALSDAAVKIGDVVNLIAQIASQTNLLALNATIESARAGEAGRGFAVVASEVKRLAEQTAKATEDIRTQVGAIQASSRDAVGAIVAITDTIGQINEITASIAGAVEQQGAATQEIARNVQQAAQGATQISDNIAGVSLAAGDTGTSAHLVLAASKELSQQSDRMRDQVEAFLAGIKAA